ncbi:MAG: heparin lyase I family protein [Planctomycetota bacterium]
MFCLTPMSAVSADPILPTADTIIHIRHLGDASKAQGNAERLAIKTDRPRAGNDRVGVLRFDLPADAAADQAGLQLTLRPGQDIGTPIFELYGVAENAPERDFDEATFVGIPGKSAVDKSGNRISEKFAYDPDPATKRLEPLAAAQVLKDSEAICFSSRELDAYINGFAGQSVAFLVMQRVPEQDGSVPASMFQSKEARTSDSDKPLLSLDGSGLTADPATSVPVATAQPALKLDPLPLGAVVGTHVGFEPTEGAVVHTNAVRGNGTTRYHFIDEDGRRFNLPALGSTAKPELSTEQARSGTHSLKLHAPPTTTSDSRDRLEFRFKQGSNDEVPFQFGQDRWYGYSLFIDPASDPPVSGKYVHVGQLWQPSTVGELARQNEWGIPMAMSFLPNREGFVLSAVCKSDGKRSQFEIGQLETGVWHDLVFNVLLSHSKDDIDGHFRVWLNGESVVDETVEVGNYPHNQDDGFWAGDAMDIRFGIYRRAQPLTQTMFLDDVWFADTPPDPAMELRAAAH